METTIGPLLSRLEDRFDDGDLELVDLAYRRAAKHHDGRLRHSGDPYITHLIEVASLTATAKADAVSVCAALLHDIVDTGYDLHVLHAEFGAEIAGLVASVMALDPGQPMPCDQRVLLLKLFDRLHNMRTIEYLPRQKQRLKSLDTLGWLVPVARRLGLESLADAFAFVLTIPPALSTLIIRIRIHLGLERKRDSESG